MKQITRFASVLAVSALFVAALAGCSGEPGGSSGPSSAVTISSGTSAGSDVAEAGFNYSEGIDENGFWAGVTALDYVTLFDYQGISVSGDVHNISDEAVQSEIDTLLSGYSGGNPVTDRAVEDGDTVKIDFVGSVDGVEFDGGTTGGAGTEVTIGVTLYIDDFLEQLIGHKPGETFNVEVTFPENYGVDTLNGKDAVFVTTINHIVELPELTDAFVAENLSAEYGWTTAEGMRDGIRADLQKAAIQKYVEEYVLSEGVVSSVPDSIMTYMEDSLLDYYQAYAEMYGMEFEAFISTYENVATADELLAQYHDENVKMASYYLLLQAIAEDAQITVSDADVSSYFAGQTGSDDYSQYAAQYGLPYLKQVTLYQAVVDRLVGSAILA